MRSGAAPSVEVLITTCNRWHHLEKTLCGLREQKRIDLNVAVRDDGSSDGTPDRVRSRFPEVRLLGGPHLGLIGSRSVLMRTSVSDYLLHLDDDGYLMQPDAIAGCVGKMEANPFWGCVTIRVVRPDGSDEYNDEVSSGVCVPYFAGGANMLRKSVADRLGGYCDLFYYYGEELEYTARMAKYGWPVVYDREYSFYHMREGAGRDEAKIARYRSRNKIFGHVLHTPFHLAVARSAALMGGVVKGVLHGGRFSDLVWVLRETTRGLPEVLRRRSAMSRRMWALWRSLYALNVTPAEFIAGYRSTPECRRLRPELLK